MNDVMTMIPGTEAAAVMPLRRQSGGRVMDSGVPVRRERKESGHSCPRSEGDRPSGRTLISRGEEETQRLVRAWRIAEREGWRNREEAEAGARGGFSAVAIVLRPSCGYADGVNPGLRYACPGLSAFVPSGLLRMRPAAGIFQRWVESLARAVFRAWAGSRTRAGLRAQAGVPALPVLALKDALTEYAPLIAYAVSILVALVLGIAGFMALERADRGRDFSGVSHSEISAVKGGAR